MGLTGSGIGMTSARTRERLVDRLKAKGVRDPEVLERIRQIPRHSFVDEALSSRAYEDTALPIGHGQTISQPYVVARMTETLTDGRRLQKVLEIGTGCGYQCAVLAGLVEHVYSVERIGPMVQKARQRMRELGLHNVTIRHADGWHGMSRFAPFDGILVTAAPEAVPQALLEQLADGGRLVVPVGPAGMQDLTLYERHGEELEKTVLEPVSFVPMLSSLQR